MAEEKKPKADPKKSAFSIELDRMREFYAEDMLSEIKKLQANAGPDADRLIKMYIKLTLGIAMHAYTELLNKLKGGN
jgi:hypothetical protein